MLAALSSDCLAGEKHVLAVLHVKHREARQRVLAIAGRLEDPQRMAALAVPRRQVVEVAGAASLGREEGGIEIELAPALGDRQVVLALGPGDLVAAPQHRLEIEEGRRVRQVELEVEARGVRGNHSREDIGLPVARRAQHQPPAGSRCGRLHQRIVDADRQRVPHRCFLRGLTSAVRPPPDP